MFIGKWNKSVIMTYVGMFFSIMGIFFCFKEKILYALSCLIVSGICDLFDGTIARRCKRNDEEKQFGIELDSLVDVVSFIVFPIIIYYAMGFNKWYFIPFYFIYAVCGVARLAYFNISLEEENKDIAIKYYSGLPVTFVALILPVMYLISYLIPEVLHSLYFILIMFLISMMYIVNFKLKKPTLKVYPFFVILAIIVLILFLGVL